MYIESELSITIAILRSPLLDLAVGPEQTFSARRTREALMTPSASAQRLMNNVVDTRIVEVDKDKNGQPSPKPPRDGSQYD